MLVNHYHSVLAEDKVLASLKTILNKLSVETNKLHILNGLKTLPEKFRTNKNINEILSQIILFIASNLINNKLAAVKEGAHLSILAILRILGNGFQPHSARLLELSGTLIDAREFPEYLVELSRLYPNLFAKSINKLCNLQGVHPSVVTQIILSNKIALQALLTTMKESLVPDNLLFSIDILVLLGVNAADFVGQIADSLWGSLCLRIVGLSNDQKYF